MEENPLTRTIWFAIMIAITVRAMRKSREDNQEGKDNIRDEESTEQGKMISKNVVWEGRKHMFCSAQSVSYSNSNPLMVVRGSGQYLFDEMGIQYLDTRNNVGHVGWQNEFVVRAIQNQIALTNSNTRYLHPNTVLLAKKLLAKMPKSLSKVFFVNSGSEANDLALRLSRAATGGKGDCIVVERAYHGNTCATIDLSPYKFLGKGGQGQPDWIHVVPCPDAYRNRKTEESISEFSDRFAGYVRKACDLIKAREKMLGAFFIESGMSVAGVILPPVGYLSKVYEIVRSYGGVCVADEVQVGFGRFGTHYWGFEQQGVVPDIVTMGKPFGNGFPLAAVVCTAEIAQAFHNGMEYFNTFGGNPVACSAGLAVMEVLEKDNLVKKALRTGQRLKGSLEGLMQTNHGSIIGDIRGSGLFLGIEFVRDRVSKEPATEEVSWIATKLLRDHRILTSCDGAHYNVLVLKPPMTFSEDDADRFVAALSLVLTDLVLVDRSTITLTPT